jgi:hypothetical protein
MEVCLMHPYHAVIAALHFGVHMNLSIALLTDSLQMLRTRINKHDTSVRRCEVQLGTIDCTTPINYWTVPQQEEIDSCI